MTEKMKSVFENLASIKEEEAKAYRELANAVDEDTAIEAKAEKTKGEPVEAVKEPEVKKTESKVTFEQLKSLFAEKSQAGHTAELKEILNKLGAAKISAVKPEDYESAYLAAQEIK